uniref:Skp1-related protein n=1 Tax=Panagrolaimus sp. ES5 TaxID=591445 RepID=A0AC34GP22_9BILA
MAAETTGNKYKLISSDNKTFEASDDVIKQNDIWGAIYECGGKPDEEIPIKDIDGKTLKKVVAFCEKFANDPKYDANDPKEPASLRSDVRVINFFKDFRSTNDLLELVNAANYLNNQRLIDACLLHIHRNLEGSNVEEIREKLHLKNDFSPEEEKAFTPKNLPFSFLHHHHHHLDLADYDIPDFNDIH